MATAEDTLTFLRQAAQLLDQVGGHIASAAIEGGLSARQLAHLQHAVQGALGCRDLFEQEIKRQGGTRQTRRRQRES
jgi:hypothetical protein